MDLPRGKALHGHKSQIGIRKLKSSGRSLLLIFWPLKGSKRTKSFIEKRRRSRCCLLFKSFLQKQTEEAEIFHETHEMYEIHSFNRKS